MPPSLPDLLAPHRDDAWIPSDPATPEELDTAELALGHRLPPELRAVLLAGGGAVYGAAAAVGFLPARRLPDFLPATCAPALDGMVLFADDEGDFWYFLDPDDRLGRGPGAVWIVEKSVIRPGGARFCAPDVPGLVERVLDGVDFTDGPTLDRLRAG